jgi:hypothetical protein
MIKVILLALWQFPQNIIAGILLHFLDVHTITKLKKSFFKAEFSSKNLSSFSLGKFIFINTDYTVGPYDIAHEYGHSVQSLYYGFLYVFIVGIPSVIRNIIARIAKKDDKWYYGHFPESQADKLGGVNREGTEV